MFAVQFDRFGPPEVLTVGEFPEPHAGADEVRIRVRTAGLSPVDLAIRSGTSPSASRLALPHIPGVDAAGIVDEVGQGVEGTAIGDEVFGAVDVARLGGASAELAVLAFWAARPESLSWEEAGAAGTSVETATRVLDLLGVKERATLLIDGAAGGVGSVAVQLAVARGARVIGTGNPENQDFVASLGALPTTYGRGLPERIRGLGPVDLALHVGGTDALPELIEITGSAARVVTISDFGGPQLGVRVSMGDLAGQAHGRNGLAAAATLSEAGRFRVPLRQVFPFSHAAQAHALAERRPRWGKIALSVDRTELLDQTLDSELPRYAGAIDRLAR